VAEAGEVTAIEAADGEADLVPDEAGDFLAVPIGGFDPQGKFANERVFGGKPSIPSWSLQ